MTELWAPYSPDFERPWNLSRVVHLHRRAAFAGTWDELQRDLTDGPEKAVTRLLEGTSNQYSPDDFEAVSTVLTNAAVNQAEIARLKAAWIYRLLFSPNPLLEKLTLLWHDHFATAANKVEDVALMRRQNETLRKHATAKFADLLNASVREPALLLYLDAQVNQKGRPNENLARELLELFTLGVGNYTEIDVKEAARALTGWSVEDGLFLEKLELHDDGEKTILGTKAQFSGSALVEKLLTQPSVVNRVVLKLVRQFFGENLPSPNAVKQLTVGLRERELRIGWAVETILRSRLFFDTSNVRSRVLSPVEFVIGSTRALERFDHGPNAQSLAGWAARMGQDVFDPPNVGGWPDGRKWLHSRSLIARANFASALVTGRAGGHAAHEAGSLARKHGFGTTPADLLTFHHRLLFGTDPTASLRTHLGQLEPLRMVTALLSSPDAQVG